MIFKSKMMKFKYVLLMAAMIAPAYSWKDKTRAVGYLMEWRDVPSQERVAGYSHIILTGFKLDAELRDGTLDTSKHVDPTKVDSLVKLGNLENTKIMLMLGGWGSEEGFKETAGTPEARLKLASQLSSYCLAHGLSGVDIDWEFPRTASQFQNYEYLMKDLREEFDKHSLLLSSAIGQEHYLKFTAKTYEYLHWVNIMSYDMNWASQNNLMKGNHSPADVHIEYLPKWEAVSIPKEKLVLGVPFYGRQSMNWGATLSYSEIFEDENPNPSENVKGAYNFNGNNTIYNKTAYIVRENYGGIMVWEIEHDLPADHESNLQKSMLLGISEALAGVDVEKEVTADVNEGYVPILGEYKNESWEFNNGFLKNTDNHIQSVEFFNMKGQGVLKLNVNPNEILQVDNHLSPNRYLVKLSSTITIEYLVR